MRIIILFAVGLIFANTIQAQIGSSISADGTAPNNNAMLDVQSPSTGAGKGILIPRVSLAQRTTLDGNLPGGLLDDSGNLRGGAAQGLMVYQTDGAQGLYFNTSSSAMPAWAYLGDINGLLASNVWASAGSTTNYLPRTGGTMSGALNMGAQIVTNVAHVDFNGDTVSVGRGANGSAGGAAVGYSANGYIYSAAMGYQANSYWYGAAVGTDANGTNSGAALGTAANGSSLGAAVGREADGSVEGVAVGYAANGYYYGAAIGKGANGYSRGAAVGYLAKGTNYGAAIGVWANGFSYGAAVGREANGSDYGAAVGFAANGVQTNVAIGARANAQAGTQRIAIGNDVTNAVNNSAVIRGTLYLDGGTGVMTRATFGGAGAWNAKTFEIDHPLDPENKILRHYCLEGPQVWNVYAGNAQLVNGQAVIELPEYYSALNLVGSEICSLTPWGRANVWVAQGVDSNTFSIAGDADVKVSWTIKVLRNDPGCLEDLRRRPVEQLKNEIR